MQLRIQLDLPDNGSHDTIRTSTLTQGVSAADSSGPKGVRQDTLKKKLEFYRDKLLQLERRNRSIMLRRIYDKWSFDLAKLIIRGPHLAERVVERAILKKSPICLIADSDSSELAEKDRNKLRSLYRNITQIELETGLRETYLGFPFLAGHITGDSYVRGPFALFPISIEHRKEAKPSGWYLSFSKEKQPILNRALMAAMRKKCGITLSESFYEEFEDLLEKVAAYGNTNQSSSESKDGEVTADNNKQGIESIFVRELIHLLLKNDFPLRESENKMDKIEILEPLSAEQELVMPKENLHFVNYKVIGNFPQGDTAIYADYEELMKRAESGETNQGIIDNLLEIPSPQDLWNEGNDGGGAIDGIDLDKIPARNLNLVIESDASQEAVIVAAQSSECTVVRGPPGTGKSQVIVNLIANALANEKKVLVVCQKRAALDVVFQRLNKVGLSKYVTLLHDPINDRAEVYQRLSKLLNFGSSTFRLDDTTTTSPSTIELRANQLSQSIDNIIESQRAIVLALRQPHFEGVTAHQLYALAQPGYYSKLDLSTIAPKVSYPELKQLTEAVRLLEEGCKKFDAPLYPLAHRKSFASFGMNDKIKLVDAIDELIQKVADNGLRITVLSSPSNQKSLIESLRVLSSETGLFRKIKPKWSDANNRVKVLLNDQNFQAGDTKRVNSILAEAEMGLGFWNSLSKLASFLDETGFGDLVSNAIPIWNVEDLRQKLIKIKESLADFETLQEHDNKKASLSSLQRDLLHICESKLMNDTNWDKILQQEFYAYWINVIERENPALKNQPFETYLENRKRLSTAMREHRSLVIQQIGRKIESRITRPGSTPNGKRSHRSEILLWNKLADDLDKKRRVLPVRKLIEKYEPIIFNVAPCWLASPEAVASVFPLKRNIFDYIIFDEASQSAVERSLTSLYRGSHIVIMGDEKQLRPFDLFRTKDEEEEDGEELVDDGMLSESLLVLAKRIYGYRYLAWHYRSKYQELIDYSNHAFYDGHLQVAPNILRSSTIPPIRWIRCKNGLWENRQNLPEAVLVVNEIKKILIQNETESKFRSIGVITFNESQQMAILDEIDRRRQEDTEFDELFTATENSEGSKLDDKPFVKNIENVQGDERDIIIFSVGYARDADGHLHTRFGTLNQEGGENRLNVAITRAKQEIVIVCSVDPDELKTDSAKNNGPKRLKDYLRYAKFISECRREGAENILLALNDGFMRAQGADDTKNNSTALIFESPFEELVYERLRSLGYMVDVQVGYSGYKIDLAVVHPDDPSRYILAIECDGATFHSAKSTRERDVMRQEFLESRGWIVERIWSRNWWRNPDREIQRVKQTIEQLRTMQVGRISKE